MGQAWLQPPAAKYGGSLLASGQATHDATATVHVAPSPVPALGGLFHKDSPMFAFAVIGAAAVALMAYSTIEVSGGAKVGKKIKAEGNLEL